MNELDSKVGVLSVREGVRICCWIDLPGFSLLSLKLTEVYDQVLPVKLSLYEVNFVDEGGEKVSLRQLSSLFGCIVCSYELDFHFI